MKRIAATLLSFSMTLLAESKSLPPKGSSSGPVKHVPAGRPEMLKPEQKAAYKGIEITILGARTAAEYVNAPSEGKKYIVLRFKVKNLSNEEINGRSQSRNLQWSDLKAEMRRGTEGRTGVQCNNPENTDLAPGAEGEFEDVYMIPKEYSEVEIHYVLMDPLEKARWLVPVK